MYHHYINIAWYAIETSNNKFRTKQLLKETKEYDIDDSSALKLQLKDIKLNVN